MRYKQFDVNEETLFLVEVSKHAYDFDIWVLGMIFCKRKDMGYERKTFFYLPSYMACKKEIIGKLSELDLQKTGFGGISLEEILREFERDSKCDYLILKKM